MELNKTELARTYGLNRETVIKYCKRCIKDESNITQEEYNAVLDLCEKKNKDKTEQSELLRKLVSVKSNKHIDFKIGESNTEELLKQEIDDYNFFIWCIDQDKKKLDIIDNANELYFIVTKNIRENIKVLHSIEERILKYEKEIESQRKYDSVINWD